MSKQRTKGESFLTAHRRAHVLFAVLVVAGLAVVPVSTIAIEEVVNVRARRALIHLCGQAEANLPGPVDWRAFDDLGVDRRREYRIDPDSGERQLLTTYSTGTVTFDVNCTIEHKEGMMVAVSRW